jgi:hypothetical protein
LVIWLCGETSAILVAVAADFFFDGRHLEAPTDVMHRHRWEDSISMYLVGWTGMDWTHFAQDRDQLASGRLREHDIERSGAINCWKVI